MNRLYLVVATDEGGNNQDYFVSAKDPQDAYDLWESGVICQNELDGDLFDMFTEGDVVRVYEAPPAGHSRGFHTWWEPTKFLLVAKTVVK